MLLSFILAACIIAAYSNVDMGSARPMSPEEAQAVHRALKQRDLEKNRVHSVVNYDTIKQRYQDYRESQKELKK